MTCRVFVVRSNQHIYTPTPCKSAIVKGSPPYLVTACVAPFVSNKTGSVPVVPVGTACARLTKTVPRYQLLANAWLANVKTTLSAVTLTPVDCTAAEPRLLTQE